MSYLQSQKRLFCWKKNVLQGEEIYIKVAGIECKLFEDGKPGRHWYEGFMQRHYKHLSKRTPQYSTKDRYKVTEKDLRECFEDVKSHLENKNLIRQICNYVPSLVML